MSDNRQKIRKLAAFLKHNPDDSFTKFALALELLKLNEVSKARVLFESILEQDPAYLGVYYHLGKLYEQTGRLQDAANLFETGIDFARAQGNERTRAELAEALESVNTELNHDQ
jgi:Tfp pilus assembly protein PilF